MTGYATKEKALEAVRLGACDFFSKPFSLAEMEVVIRRVLERRALTRELRRLKSALADTRCPAIVGQSQGMLSENSRNAVDKYPMLGDIPVLGNLFKSSEYQKDQSELVIIITAHLVKPLDKKHMILPTDLGHEPDEVEFYLNYGKGGNTQTGVAAGGPTLDGDFGHDRTVAGPVQPSGDAVLRGGGVLPAGHPARRSGEETAEGRAARLARRPRSAGGVRGGGHARRPGGRRPSDRESRCRPALPARFPGRDAGVANRG